MARTPLGSGLAGVSGIVSSTLSLYCTRGCCDDHHTSTAARKMQIDMKPQTKQIVVLIAGWSFIVLGIVGLILPFLQGVLFLLVGLAILSSEYAWARRLLTKVRERFPKVGRIADQAMAKAALWLKRLSHGDGTN
jgi:uncharacterized protein